MADFNPDEYLAVPEPRPRDKFTPVESGLIGASQGVTMGFGDEIVGALGAIGQKTMGAQDSYAELYRQLRDKARAKAELARVDNPKSYMAGNLGGSAATALIPGAGIASGAKLLPAMGKAAMMGAAQGLGESSADLTRGDIGGAAKDTGTGFAFGGATQGVLGGTGKALGAVTPTALRSLAETRAAKAVLGNNQKSFTEAAARPGGVRALGRSALDEGIVSPLVSTEEMLGRASSAKTKFGNAIGKLTEDIDKYIEKTNSGRRTSGKVIADRISEYRSSIPDVPQNSAVRNSLDDQIKYYSKKEGMTLNDLQRLKNSYKFDPREQSALSLGKEASNELKGILGNRLEERVDWFAPLAGKEDDYLKLKKGYGAAATAEKALKRQAQRDVKNRLIEPSTYMAGAGAAAGGGGGLGALAAGVANKAGLKYGNQAMAVGADKAAMLLERSPELLQEFAGPLHSALQKSLQSGGPSFAVTHQLLLKNPKYRQILNDEALLKEPGAEFNPDDYLK